MKEEEKMIKIEFFLYKLRHILLTSSLGNFLSNRDTLMYSDWCTIHLYCQTFGLSKVCALYPYPLNLKV